MDRGEPAKGERKQLKVPFIDNYDRAAKVNFLFAYMQGNGDSRLNTLVDIMKSGKDSSTASGEKRSFAGHAAVVEALKGYPDLLALLFIADTLAGDNRKIRDKELEA